MKKFLFGLFIFLCFFFINTNFVQARCFDSITLGEKQCTTPYVSCLVNDIQKCCDNQADCDTEKATHPPSTTTVSCATPQLINTAIGPIDVCDINALTSSILRLGIGIGGGIAFILMLAAVFMIMTSAGDPKRMQAGQELITSALMGLLLIIFSVFLLHFIGVDILAIPGFSK
jgi:hypothetical protein